MENAHEQKFDVVLFPTYAQAMLYRKKVAARYEGGLFGTQVTSFSAWFADVWEQYGDGRTLITDAQRKIALSLIFCEYPSIQTDRISVFSHVSSAAASFNDFGEKRALSRRYRAVAGMVSLAAQCVEQAAGLDEFEQALNAAASGDRSCVLDDSEWRFLACVARYRHVIKERGFVEEGEALTYLASCQSEVFAPCTRILWEGLQRPSIRQQRFFESCTHLEFVQGLENCTDEAILPLPPETKLRFAFSAGRYAQAHLLMDIISEVHNMGGIAITSKDPFALYEAIESACVREGIVCAVRARKPFSRTDFGRAFLSLYRCVRVEPWQKTALSDFLFSPFSGFSLATAQRFDSALRKDRLLDRETCLAQMRTTSDLFSHMEELVQDPEADVLLGVVEDSVRALSGVSEAWRCEQFAALKALRVITSAARSMQAPIEACIPLLEEAQVDVSRATQETGAPHIYITSQESAALSGKHSYATVIACDMTNASYPIVARENAMTVLFTKLGIDLQDDTLFRQRRTFNCLACVPSRELIIERCLNDVDAEPTYPAAVVEELVDCYRPHPADTSDIDNPYMLPPSLRQGSIEWGEETLYENEAVTHHAQQVAARVPLPLMHDVSPEQRLFLVPPRRSFDGSFMREHCFSPSQIENYLACPARWFAQNRCNPESLDEGFGALECGVFAHAALEEFYHRFQEETGVKKLRQEDLVRARVIMAEVLDWLEDDQRNRPAGEGRLVPCSELEFREVAALKRRLIAYLDFEAELLPTFSPRYFEYTIDVDHAVDYAGYKMLGTIDRIDMDDKGRAIIIDYKGSLSNDYNIFMSEDERSSKIQAYIYAQVVQRLLGVQVVGAFYVSYGASRALCGAYDGNVVEAAHLPAMKHERCCCAAHTLTFSEMLVETEQRVQSALENLLAGRVGAAPLSSSSCRWCPVLACSERMPS